MKDNSQAPETNSIDSGVLSNPLSFLRNGYIYWNDASLYSRGGYGSYWSLRSTNTTYSNFLGFSNTYLNPQSDNLRGYSFAVRSL